MPPTATKAPPRNQLDDSALADELKQEHGEDDGLGDDGVLPQPEVSQEEYDDPNSEYNTKVPGGRKPGDDGYVEPEGEDAGQAKSPPTPPADLGGAGEPEQFDTEDEDEDKGGLELAGDRELGLKVGGEKPDNCRLKFKGATVDLGKGQMDRGARVRTVDVWQVTGDNDQDTIATATGEVKSTSKTQTATLCGTKRLEEWLAEGLREFEMEEDVRRIMGGLGLETPEIEE